MKWQVNDRIMIVGNHSHTGKIGVIISLEPPNLSNVVSKLRNMVKIRLDDSIECYCDRSKLRLMSN